MRLCLAWNSFIAKKSCLNIKLNDYHSELFRTSSELIRISSELEELIVNYSEL